MRRCGYRRPPVTAAPWRRVPPLPLTTWRAVPAHRTPQARPARPRTSSIRERTHMLRNGCLPRRARRCAAPRATGSLARHHREGKSYAERQAGFECHDRCLSCRKKSRPGRESLAPVSSCVAVRPGFPDQRIALASARPDPMANRSRSPRLPASPSRARAGQRGPQSPSPPTRAPPTRPPSRLVSRAVWRPLWRHVRCGRVGLGCLHKQEALGSACAIR